jgi:hypothetical protein
MWERANKYCEDVHRFDGTAHTVYEQNDDGVYKYERWRNRAVTVRSHTPRCVLKIADTDEGKVNDTIGAIDERMIRESGDGVEDLDAVTEERLKNLGYI